MFNREKTPAAADKYNSSSATLISTGTTLLGDVTSDNDLRIDGIIHGNVSSSAKIIVGLSGFIEGNIEGHQADISGKVHGNIITADLLQLRAQCNVQGNITSGKLEVEPTATFNGQVQMSSVANIVQMSSDDVQSEAQ